MSPAYVQEQLGHATMELTVGVYGRWLRKRSPGALDRLAERAGELAPRALGSRLVATPFPGSAELEPPQGVAAGAEYNLC